MEKLETLYHLYQEVEILTSQLLADRISSIQEKYELKCRIKQATLQLAKRFAIDNLLPLGDHVDFYQELSSAEKMPKIFNAAVKIIRQLPSLETNMRAPSRKIDEPEELYVRRMKKNLYYQFGWFDLQSAQHGPTASFKRLSQTYQTLPEQVKSGKFQVPGNLLVLPRVLAQPLNQRIQQLENYYQLKYQHHTQLEINETKHIANFLTANLIPLTDQAIATNTDPLTSLSLAQKVIAAAEQEVKQQNSKQVPNIIERIRDSASMIRVEPATMQPPPDEIDDSLVM